MIPAVLALASGTLLFSREGADAPPFHADFSWPQSEDTLETPLGLTRKQWIAFLKVAQSGKPCTVTPAFRLGAFGMTVRRLCDLGAMEDPQVIRYKGRQVWDARWANPSDLKAFQGAPLTQYALFCESMTDYNDREELARTVGQIVDGQTVTRSGALMLAHRAGLAGMASWVQDPKIRHRFRDNTTAFFGRANGIF